MRAQPRASRRCSTWRNGTAYRRLSRLIRQSLDSRPSFGQYLRMTKKSGIPNQLLDVLPAPESADEGEERVDVLVQSSQLRIERIVSTGQASPPGFWYDQDEHEWVLLLSGEAGLRFEHEEDVRRLAPGDQVHIPAHARHRVEWTSEAELTIWLAVFYRS